MTIEPPNSPSARDIICDAISQVAPDVEPGRVAALADDAVLRDELDLDSMDQHNVAIEIFERCGLDIPDSDFAQMNTLGSFEAYLHARLGG